MALSVTHTFVSAIPDDADATLVRPSNWNAAHTISGTVGNASLDDMAANTIKGRLSTTGAPQDLTGTQTTALLDAFTSTLKGLAPSSGGGAVNFLRADGTWAAPAGSGVVSDGDKGDITVSGTGTVWTIDNDVVTYAKMQNVSATNRFIGRITSGSGDPEELTGTQATTLLDAFTTSLKGLAPSSGGGTTNFLRADGTWNAPPSGGTPGGSTLQVQYNNASAFGGMSGTSWDDTNRSLTMTGATVTTSNPVLNMTQTWNAGAVAFSGLKLNVTNTASAAGSTLMDLQTGGANTFKVVTGTAATAVPSIQVGTTGTSTGWIIGYAGNTGGAAIFNSNVTPSSSNYAIYSDSSQSIINAPTTVDFRIGGASQASVIAAEVRLALATKLTWGGDVIMTRPGIAATLQFGAADAATATAQTLQPQSIVAGTANGTAGADWTFKTSSGTGTGTGGNFILKTPFSAKSSGTGQGTWVDRDIYVSKGKVLTSATPVSLFEIALPALAMCGGTIYATIICTNGTDMQSFSQAISYSAVNKAGVYTKSITAATGDKSVTGASTLTTTWSLLDGTNKVTVQVSATTSLTPSTNAFICYYSMANNSEQATTIL